MSYGLYYWFAAVNYVCKPTFGDPFLMYAWDDLHVIVCTLECPAE